MTDRAPGLFDPIEVGGRTVRNRLWVPAMCQYSVFAGDGVPTDWHLVHLGSLAAGGTGLIVTEATAVSPEGRISPRDTGLWNDAQRDAWRPIAEFIGSQGVLAGVQLAHAGRKASTWPAWGFEDRRGSVPASEGGWPTVAPSAIPFGEAAVPSGLESAGIEKVVDDFARAAIRAVEAGFGLIELHAAHGYLLHQFLSPLSNARTDEYGGALENRARLLLRVIRAIRDRVGAEAALMVRFSATDYAEGGWDEHQTATVAGWARAAGADFFDISSGGNVSGARIPLGPGYQVPYADYVKRTASVPVAAVGLITTPAQAARIVAEGSADAVLLARESLRDPHFPLRAAHELGVELDYWPPQYRRAMPFTG